MPQKIKLFIYTCPIICIGLAICELYSGYYYGSFNFPRFILSFILLLSSTALYPFLKKQKNWARRIIVWLSFAIVLFCFLTAIEIPMLLILPLMAGVKIFVFFSMIYFSYFFIIFISDRETLVFFGLLDDPGKESSNDRNGEKSKETKLSLSGEETSPKFVKYRKMFVTGIIVAFAFFTATSFLMVFTVSFNYSNEEQKNPIEFIEKLAKKINVQIEDNLSRLPASQTGQQTQNQNSRQNTSNSEFQQYEYNGLKFKVQKSVQKKDIDSRSILFFTGNKEIAVFQFVKTFIKPETLLKQTILFRYGRLAAIPGIKNINAVFFDLKNSKGTACYINADKHNEMIVLLNTNNGLIYVVANMGADTVKHVYTIFKTISI